MALPKYKTSRANTHYRGRVYRAAIRSAHTK